jgi:hypothetical protein
MHPSFKRGEDELLKQVRRGHMPPCPPEYEKKIYGSGSRAEDGSDSEPELGPPVRNSSAPAPSQSAAHSSGGSAAALGGRGHDSMLLSRASGGSSAAQQQQQQFQQWQAQQQQQAAAAAAQQQYGEQKQHRRNGSGEGPMTVDSAAEQLRRLSASNVSFDIDALTEGFAAPPSPLGGFKMDDEEPDDSVSSCIC